ncbi:hypothetical protein BJP41_10845 (plasmid) [Candidatus Williamhamiltonella defendens]|uniref:Uncharacterized protein n=1 Tax=Candidatus Williamhamiltonella defendens TaxID=138072 RepID=A0A2D3TAN6_9ENTR|nr:hypothetical protein [Candidatus Hamiltonella defensa]ASV34532.1 hypothetical protein CJJ18_11060 [Candidatus Hamiltonella defensa]ATW30952.1 hypothetical protein BJP41_10845 [Candidatus Hamiltonella defensa]ATW32845.1 hypothetical protein BJP42_10660 [Candidatus Hamiltonella defensa]AWK17488.1 hypothetical protein CCS40_10885 [Candidatus Hamiltonella defensa]MBK4362073.1 hypothetical protein [Candidatus Hamiltonella defensa]
MFKQLSRPGKNIYVGAVLRDRLDKMVLDIGHYVGRPVTVSEFVRYLIEKSGNDAQKRLKKILGTEKERKQFSTE